MEHPFDILETPPRKDHVMRVSGIGVVALVAVALASPAQAGPETFAEAKALAAEQGKPVLVDFYATW